MKKLLIGVLSVFLFLASTTQASAQTKGFGALLEKFGIVTTTSTTTTKATVTPRPTWYPKPMVTGYTSSPDKPLLPVEDSRNTKPLLPAEENRNTKPLLPVEENRNQKEAGQASGDSQTTNRKDTTAGIVSSFEKRLDNYKGFLSKVKTRRDKLSGAGQDVAKLNAFIVTGAANLEKVESTLTAAKTKLSALDYSKDPSLLKEDIRKEITPVRTEFTKLHKSMSETVSEVIVKTAAEVQARPTKTVLTPTPTGVFPAKKGNGIENNNRGGNTK